MVLDNVNPIPQLNPDLVSKVAMCFLLFDPSSSGRLVSANSKFQVVDEKTFDPTNADSQEMRDYRKDYLEEASGFSIASEDVKDDDDRIIYSFRYKMNLKSESTGNILRLDCRSRGKNPITADEVLLALQKNGNIAPSSGL